MRPGFWRYVATWLGLLALTATSFGASYLSLSAFEMPVALAIAVTKAVLVALFFMHLAEARFAYKFVLLGAVLFVILIVGLTAADVMTREVMPVAPPLL